MANPAAASIQDHRLIQFPERHVSRRLMVSPDQDTEYSSIQDAINDARAGDTIVLDAGMYFESVVVDKPLTILGPTDPRFAEEDAFDDDLPYALIIGVDGAPVTWAATGGSLRDVAISRGPGGEEFGQTAIVHMLAGQLQLMRCVISDGAHCGIGVTGGNVDVSRCHIRNVETGICIADGSAEIRRTHVEGFDVVAVNVEAGAEILLEDNSFEGRTVLRGTVRAFTGNDFDTLFVEKTMPVKDNRIGSLVHLYDFRPVGGAAVGS